MFLCDSLHYGQVRVPCLCVCNVTLQIFAAGASKLLHGFVVHHKSSIFFLVQYDSMWRLGNRIMQNDCEWFWFGIIKSSGGLSEPWVRFSFEVIFTVNIHQSPTLYSILNSCLIKHCQPLLFSTFISFI